MVVQNGQVARLVAGRTLGMKCPESWAFFSQSRCRMNGPNCLCKLSLSTRVSLHVARQVLSASSLPLVSRKLWVMLSIFGCSVQAESVSATRSVYGFWTSSVYHRLPWSQMADIWGVSSVQVCVDSNMHIVQRDRLGMSLLTWPWRARCRDVPQHTARSRRPVRYCLKNDIAGHGLTQVSH